MLQFMQAVPQAAQVAADLVAENMDFNNSEAIASRLKKMLPPNLLSPEEQEEIAKNTPKQEAPPPSPEQIKAQSDMEMKQLDMQMKTQEQQFQIQMEEIKLQTAELNLRSKEVDAGQKIREANEIEAEERKEEAKENMAKEIAEKMKNRNVQDMES
jgi:beta-xylosidase